MNIQFFEARFGVAITQLSDTPTAHLSIHRDEELQRSVVVKHFKNTVTANFVNELNIHRSVISTSSSCAIGIQFILPLLAYYIAPVTLKIDPLPTNKLIIELVQRGDLFDILETMEYGIPEREALRIFRQVAQALQHIHELGFAHMDVSLENVLITANWDSRLCDFGLAREYHNIPSSPCGKPGYMAPEISLIKTSRTQLFDLRPSDIFSLGCCIAMTILHFPLFKSPDSRVYQILLEDGLDYVLNSYRRAGTTIPPLSKTTIDLLHSMLRPLESRHGLRELLQHPAWNM